MDKEFNIAIVATMSAGKSTLINCLLGKELLHSANEATTAKVTCIEQDNHKEYFSGTIRKTRDIKTFTDIYSWGGELLKPYEDIAVDNISLENLKLWNQDSNVHSINISGPFRNLPDMGSKIKIFDTPGPNNSQDPTHEKCLIDFVENQQVNLMIYVINATQIGTNDDRVLLGRIIKNVGDNIKDILIVLNKIDKLDEEKNENLGDILGKMKDYLNDIKPSFKFNITPVSSLKILLASKYLHNESMTAKERAQLLEEIDQYALANLSDIDIHQKDYIAKKMVFDQVTKQAGLGALIEVIEGYIATRTSLH
ncbi:hypothetical protein DC083_09005 [Ignatzschineria ureiclastica]|uniref:Dynamin N-terminal domain-containing protein n=1 Tax=Ignatzschineria ureiclastica TaxID=472582 RepID=A0A2U2ACQ5_9GAMM|nr:dynamin family protein [Ignatzschineria ureiclastica]PWD80442.1 hypothetical protein DC083_09005 [Ignatzschineria ureiclastica]GGZ99487.1 hypothetical protein GCM10007162_14530 [Ignatzschineria ureiclastica]